MSLAAPITNLLFSASFLLSLVVELLSFEFDLLSFLLKSSGCLAFFLLFYHLLLERERMHSFKRYYLLAALVLSLVIPAVTFTEYVEPDSGDSPTMTAPAEGVAHNATLHEGNFGRSSAENNHRQRVVRPEGSYYRSFAMRYGPHRALDNLHLGCPAF